MSNVTHNVHLDERSAGGESEGARRLDDGTHLGDRRMQVIFFQCTLYFYPF